MVRCVELVSHHLVSAEERAFAALGRLIGQRPLAVIAVASLLLLAPAPGVFLLEGEGNVLGLPMDTDFMTTFTLTDSKEYLQYKKAVSVFADPRSIGVLETPLGGKFPLSAEVLRAAMTLETKISADVRATLKGRDIAYADVCAKANDNGPCTQMSAASAFLGTGAAAEARLTQLATLESNGLSAMGRAKWLLQGMPHAADRYLLPVLVAVGSTDTFPGGGATDDALAAWLVTARTLTARLDLVDSREARAFEREVERRLHDGRLATSSLRTSVMTSGTVGEECTKIGTSAIPLLLAAIVLMSTYVMLFLGAETRSGQDTQILVILAGTTIPGLSSFAAMGFCGFCGLNMVVLALMAPFLGLAVGVDAMFIVISSIVSAGKEEKDPSDLMAVALPRAGVAMTATTLTSVAAFATAALSCLNFPGFFVFSLMLVLSLVFNWVGMLTLLPAFVVLNERRIAKGRFDVLPCRKRKETGQSPRRGLLARADAGRRCRELVANRFAPLVERNLACQLTGGAIWVGLLIFGIALLPGLDKGMPDSYFVVESSPTQDYFRDAEASFGQVVGIGVSIYFERPQLSDPVFRQALANYTTALGSRSDAIAPVDCWLAGVSSSLPTAATSAQATAVVRQYLASSAGARHAADARIGANGEVEGARCHLFLWQSSEAATRAAQAEDLIAVTDRAGLSAIAYHMTWPIHVARYREILRMTLTSTLYAGVAVAVSLLLTLPAHLAMLALANVAAVVTVLFGYMAAAGITCSAISYTVVLMSVGFCVDYSCHMVHFSDHGVKPGTPWDLRMGHALRECGFDVMQGCMTAFLGIALLGINAAMGFRIFAAMSVVITGLGGIFALWGLPAILALSARAMRGGAAAPHTAKEEPNPESKVEPNPEDDLGKLGNDTDEEVYI